LKNRQENEQTQNATDFQKYGASTEAKLKKGFYGDMPRRPERNENIE